MGFILLEGGAEFGGRMADADRQAIGLTGGFDSPIRIIPAAAAPDHNHQRAGQNGIDEQTGTLNDASQENWRVYGKGKITLYHSGLVDKFGAGQEFDLKE